jgi:hypothetical protein
MLSQETLAAYRRMTPGQRLEFAFAMIRENTPYLLRGRPDVVSRRFDLLERENDLRNEGILRGMSRLQQQDGIGSR